MHPDQFISAQFKLTYPRQKGKGFTLDVSLKIPASGVTAIFGSSGCGKTSLLRCMAGLEKVTDGEFILHESIWQTASHFTPVHERQQGVVFQDARLFEHLNVQGNLDFVTKRLPSESKNNSGSFFSQEQIVELLGIEHLLFQMPSELSGGEKQRVAIARALLRQPKILFMDEPLAALDYKRKQEILPYLEKLSHTCRIPIIYITHSLDEVARLADYLVLMEAGKVIASGALEDVLSRVTLPIPLNNEMGVVLKAIVKEKDSGWYLMSAEFNGGSLWLKDTGQKIGESLRVRILAKDISLALAPQDSSILNCLPAVVLDIVSDADEAMSLVQLQVGEAILIARITRRSLHHLSLQKGLAVWAQVKSVAILS